MPEGLVTYLLIAIVALVVLAVVLVGVALGRLRADAVERIAMRRGLQEVESSLAQVREQGRMLDSGLDAVRRDHAQSAQALRSEVGDGLSRLARLTQDQLRLAIEGQAANTQATTRRMDELRESNQARLEAVRLTIEQRLDLLREDNAHKLDQMRATVDEKLQQTLETRLTESFRQVAQRLDQVHKGLGEMQTLAAGVGDLKRVLANVKNRGTWGEMQLGALLGDVLVPGQFAVNVETVPGSNRRVEFAIRMPATRDEAPCWVPVDSKFPLDEWERLQHALDRADTAAAELARRGLAQFARTQAKKVHESYVAPPHTTEFAFMFIPTESLYAELMSRPGLADELQREHRVVLAGPSNFLAFLNIVQMGFHRVAIEERSAEVWRILGAVRTEFGKFSDIIGKAQKKLEEATRTLDEARGKTTTINRRLRDVQALPDAESLRLITGQLAIDLDAEAASPREEK